MKDDHAETSLTSDELTLLESNDSGAECEGLHSASWIFRPLMPQRSDAELEELGRRTVKTLVCRRFLALYRRSAWIGGTETEIPFEVSEAVLADPTNWLPPADDASDYVCYMATPLGEDARKDHYRREQAAKRQEAL